MNKKSKKILHGNYLEFYIPENWTMEEDEGIVNIYDEINGSGALTLSFYDIVNPTIDIDDHIKTLANRFIASSKIKLYKEFILKVEKGKHIIYGSGILPNNWYIKIWLIAHNSKVILATYQSMEKTTSEMSQIESIIYSFKFIN